MPPPVIGTFAFGDGRTLTEPLIERRFAARTSSASPAPVAFLRSDNKKDLPTGYTRLAGLATPAARHLHDRVREAAVTRVGSCYAGREPSRYAGREPLRGYAARFN